VNTPGSQTKAVNLARTAARGAKRVSSSVACDDLPCRIDILKSEQNLGQPLFNRRTLLSFRNRKHFSGGYLSGFDAPAADYRFAEVSSPLVWYLGATTSPKYNEITADIVPLNTIEHNGDAGMTLLRVSDKDYGQNWNFSANHDSQDCESPD
jgi:hypothetical protein